MPSLFSKHNMISMKIFSYNVNGMSKRRDFRRVIEEIQIHKFPDVLCLQETHSSPGVEKYWKTNMSQYNAYFSHFYGTTKKHGVAIFIKKNFPFALTSKIIDPEGRFIILKGHLYGKGINIVNLYAPADKAENRLPFFEKIGNFLDQQTYICGDFNSVLEAKDRMRNVKKFGDQELVSFKNRHTLVDTWGMQHENRDINSFSYARHPRNGPFSRLDYIFVSSNLKDNVISTDMCQSSKSDHKIVKAEIVIGPKAIGHDFKKTKPSDFSTKQFSDAFFTYWNSKMLPKFQQQLLHKVRNNTACNQVKITEYFQKNPEGRSNFKLPIFSENIDINFQEWDIFKKDIFKMAKKTSRELENTRRLEHENFIKKLNTASQVDRPKIIAAARQHIGKMEKARLANEKHYFMMEHEENTAAFYNNFKERSPSLFIDNLKVDNENILTGQSEKSDFLRSKYEQLYEKFVPKMTDEARLREYGFFSDQLVTDFKDEDGFFMRHIDIPLFPHCGPVNLNEVKAAINQMTLKKCPGEDGVCIEFYKKFRDYIAPILVQIFNKVLETGIVPTSWERSIIKLLPKDLNNICFDKLRPITLLNVDRKIFAAILAARISYYTPYYINPFQSGGVAERDVQDSVMFINMLINFAVHGNFNDLNILNVDNSKAFDRVVRAFLFYIMRHMGFPDKLVQAIETLCKHTTSQLLINGFLSEDFEISNGIPQGCPLSCILFVIVMEPLARYFLNNKEYKGITGPGGQQVKLIQHVDDMSFFSKGDGETINIIKTLLRYCEISGQQINMEKSFIISPGRNSGCNHIYNIKILPRNELKKILGVLFGANVAYATAQVWDKLYETINKTIEVLKTHHLSYFGKAKVLNTLVISKILYILPIIEFHSKKTEKLLRLIFKFLGHKGVTRDVLTLPIKLGGTGLINLGMKATSLRFKYINPYLNCNAENVSVLKKSIADFIEFFLLYQIVSKDHNMKHFEYLTLKRHSGPHMDISHPWIFQSTGNPNARRCIVDDIYYDIKKIHGLVEKHRDIETVMGFEGSKVIYNELQEMALPKVKNKFFQFQNMEEIQNICQQNVTLPAEQKILSFNFLLNYDILPNIRTRPCKMCQSNRRPGRDNVEHIFIECPNAVNAWSWLKRSLTGFQLHLGILNKTLTLDILRRKLGITSSEAQIITEMLWSIWRISRNNNYKTSNFENSRSIKILFKQRCQLIIDYRLKKDKVGRQKEHGERFKKIFNYVKNK